MNISKLQKVQERLNAPKSQYNQFGGYKYRNCEDILGALKPIMSETGTAVTLTDEVITVGERVYIKATATLYDTEDNAVIAQTSALARETEAKKGMDESQITGSASSYRRKYALNGLFRIDDNKDADYAPAEPKAEDKAKAPAFECEECGKAVDPKIARASIAKYGKVFCSGECLQSYIRNGGKVNEHSNHKRSPRV